MDSRHDPMRANLRLLTILIALGGCSAPPDSEQIKGDLIGQFVGRPPDATWKFQSLSEFEKFDITKTQRAGNITEYAADVVLAEPRGKATATLVIIYRKGDSGWQLANVTDNGSLRAVEEPGSQSVFAGPRERIYVALMKSDLRNLASAQETFFGDSARYMDPRITNTKYWQSSPGIRVDEGRAGSAGWSAKVSRGGTAQQRTMWIGERGVGSGNEGEPTCD